MRHAHAVRRLGGLLASAFLLVTLVAVGATQASAASPSSAQGADGAIATTPAGNAVIARAPAQVLVQAPAPIDAQASRLAVYDQDHKSMATVAPHLSAGNTDGLAVGVGPLRRGDYTIVWHLTDTAGGSLGDGSSAFQVDPTGVSPIVVQPPKPTPVSSPARKTVAKWLQFLLIMVFIGALAVRFLVTAPAARQAPQADQAGLLESSDRRILLVAGAALLGFLPAVWAELAYEAFSNKIGFWHAIAPGKIWTFLSAGAPGHFWEARLLLIAVAAVAGLPLFVTSLRRPAPAGLHRRRTTPLMLAGLIAAAAELGVGTIPSTRPVTAALPRAAFTALLDLGHLLGAALWVGGLVTLVALVALPLPARQGVAFWPPAIRRFSMTATVSFGVMVLTGLWTAWIHVGSPTLLVTTIYGERLLIKLILVAALAGFGSFNLFWVLPRVEAIRQTGEGHARLAVVMHHFRRTIAVEACLGISILAIVPFLSGSARNQAFQAKQADLTQTSGTRGHVVRLKPSGLVPGITDYDVWLPSTGATRVSLGFASSKLGVPETDVVANEVGANHYRVTGLYTAMAGPWQVRVVSSPAPGTTSVTSTAFDLTVFDLKVAATTPKLKKSKPPKVHAVTWEWGIFDVSAVLAVLLAAKRLSRHLIARRVRAVAVIPPPATAPTGDLRVPVEV